MSSSIFFGGRLTHIPGSYTEVDVSALARVGLGATGIVACIGEAEGGEPQVVHKVSNPGKVADLFRSGDLLEAGKMLFDPSRDPDIPGGAQQVYFVKVNPATQSSATFSNADGDALTLTSKDFGLFTTQISVEIADGTNQGKALTLVLEDTEEEFDDVGGDNIFTALYTPGADGASTMTVAVDPDVGVTAAFTRTQAGLAESDYDGRITPFAGLLPDQDATIVPGNTARVVSASASDTAQSVTIYGVDNGTGLPTSETLLLTGIVPVVGVVTWARIHGALLSASAVGDVSVQDSVGPVTLLVINAGSTSSGGGVEVFEGALEVAAAILAVTLSDTGAQKLLLIGTNTSDVAQLEEITLNGTTAVFGTATWNSIIAVACSYVPATRNITVFGLVLNVGDTVSVVSSNAGDTTQTITIYGLNNAGAVQSEVLSLDGTTPVAGTATWSKILGVALSAVTLGVVTVQATTEDVVVFIFDGSLSRYAGFEPLDNMAVDGDSVSVVADGATTRTMLLVGLSATNAAQLEKIVLTGAVPVAGTADWSELTGLAVGHVQTARTITVSGEALDLPVATYDTVTKVLDAMNAEDGWTGTAVVSNPNDFQISDMDVTPATSVLSVTVGFGADLFAIIEKLNEESQLVEAERATPGTGAPDNTASPVFLSGGVEGVTGFSDWQDALDLLKDERVNTIVPLTDDASIHAATVEHCVFMAGAGRSERDCKLGEDSGITLTLAKAAALALNTRHAQLCIQDVERFNTDGEQEQFPPYFTAALAAGMQAGAGIGTPITFKFLNVIDVVGDDDTYTVRDDGDELIESGLNVIEFVPNVGFRWLRGVTTHLIDDNPAFVEASTNAAVNFAVFEFRRAMEFAVGKKGFAGTVNAALSIAVGILGQLVTAGAITAWQNLTMELDGDVLTVDVEIAPVQPINFVRSVIHLVSASLSAAA